MKYYFCGAFTAALLVLGSLESAQAMSKKQKEAHAICNGAYNVRVADCGKLSNANEIDKCLRKADASLKRCRRKADQMAPVQSQPGNTNSDVPVLSTE